MKRGVSAVFAVGAMFAAAAPAGAQIGIPATAKTSPVAAPVPVIAPADARGLHLALSTLDSLGKGFDRRLQAYNPIEPVELLGTTRAVYLSGYGVVFTTELMPVVTPATNPLLPTINDATRKRVHDTKVARIPDMRNMMMSLMKDAAASLNAMPAGEQVVVAARFLYLPWEDTSGLPNQILMKADRRSLLTGNNIQTEEQ